MRISDWSSDVCSSDLAPPSPQSPRTLALCFADHQICGSRPGLIIKGLRSTYVVRNMHQQVAGIVDQEIADGSPVDCKKQDERQKLRDKADRKSVVSGKSVSVRVYIGCRQIIKKTITK